MQAIHDTYAPDHQCLFGVAPAQMGYFTAAQARTCGFSSALLSWHVKRGRYIRIRNGIYRLRDYPSSPHEDMMAAWRSIGPDAVVSHESALELGTIIPNSIHLTVPRSRRYAPRLPGVTVHTTTRPISETERLILGGIPITAPARAIADAAATQIGPEQVEMAVEQALRRALTTPAELEAEARERDTGV
jgi:predicted transcriptional regulator of viral defense system